MSLAAPEDYLGILGLGAAFFLLTLSPRRPRTSETLLVRSLNTFIPVLMTGLALAGFALLVMILNRTTGYPSGAGRILLILSTGLSLALLPPLFHATARPIPLRMVSGFLLGLAWASCFPPAVVAAMAGHPGLLLLGALGGVLPDILDRWLARTLRRVAIHIVPDPLAPSADLVADALTSALARCHARGKPVPIELYPMETSGNRWRPYALSVCPADKLIRITLAGDRATCPAPTPLKVETAATITVRDEPVSLTLFPAGDGRIGIRVSPAEQTWSHSLVAVGVIVILAWVGAGGLAALIAGGAVLFHIATDQLGFTGSALFFPFRRHRVHGFQRLRETAAPVHLGIIWIAVLLTGWNGIRIATPAAALPSLVPLLVFAGILPLAGLMWLAKRGR